MIPPVTEPATTRAQPADVRAEGALSGRPLPALRARRFSSWGALRAWAFSEASRAGPHARTREVHLIVPGGSEAWAMQGAWRRRQGRRPGIAEPLIGPPAGLFRDLAGLLTPPLSEAAALPREMLMGEALLRHAGEEGAPAGDPESLVAPLLRFLDEQAGDRGIDPGRPAFAVLCERAAATFGEYAEVDAGAARLLALAGWLERVHGAYAAALDEVQKTDADGLRRRLLKEAEALRPRFHRTRALVLGEDAMRPADCQLALALLPPGDLIWALPEGAELPRLPEGVTIREEEASEAPPAPPAPTPPARLLRPGAPKSLFLNTPKRPRRPAVCPPPDEPRRPVVYGAATDAPAAPPLFDAATDREQEPEIAAALLERFRRESGDGFGGWDRCAIVARDPRNYLNAAEAALGVRRIPMATPEEPRLSREPWVAAAADVLDFAAKPGRLSRALRMMRSPFFRDPDLPAGPPVTADVLAAGAAKLHLRDTREAAALPAVVHAFEREAKRKRRTAAWLAGEERPTDRTLAKAREFDDLAATAARIVAWAEELQPLRNEAAPFPAAIRALRRFLANHLPPPPEPAAAESAEAVDGALEQAEGTAPEGVRVRDPDLFVRRVRRLLGARRAPRRGAGITPGAGVHLIAAAAAPYGDYDFLVVLGLVDGEWPGPRQANIFFPPSVLEEGARQRARRFRQREITLLRTLAGLPRRGVAFVRPQRVDGFPAAASAFEAELTNAIREAGSTMRPVSLERDAPAPPEARPLPGGLDRTAPSLRRLLDEPLSPSAIDAYHRNPAQFFARRGLRLDEERDPTDLMPPAERGELLHDFLKEAYLGRRGTDTPADAAAVDRWIVTLRREFRSFAARHLDPVEAGAEEKWLFGTPFSPGALAWFLREEAARGPTRPLQFEAWLEGEVEPAAGDAPPLLVRGRLDRLDQRPDGTRLVIDYKSGRPYGKPLQTRLYARVHEGESGVTTDYALPYFGARAWEGPDPKKGVAAEDDAIRAVRDGIAAGRFAVGDEGRFDDRLVGRSDLPDPPPPTGPPSPSAPEASDNRRR